MYLKVFAVPASCSGYSVSKEHKEYRVYHVILCSAPVSGVTLTTRPQLGVSATCYLIRDDGQLSVFVNNLFVAPTKSCA
jgi:hypothetical protein